ncbi:sugar transferase [Paeniglutamicibacter antarcticus]|uniref:Sugar transferase n=1 Tax=Paeniglutamicibacter antarcticus TaxID=494023 RepID=A0ABP9TLL8_9MICC
MKTLMIVDTLVVSGLIFAVQLNIGTLLQGVDVLIAFSAAMLWLLMLSMKGARQPQVLGVGSDEYKRVLEASILSAGLVAIATVISHGVIPYELVIFGILPGTVALLFTRWILRRILHIRARQGATLSRVVVIGGAPDVRYLVDQIKKKSASIFHVVAIVEDTGQGLVIGDIPVLHGIENLDHLIRVNGADAVMVAGSLHSGSDAVKNLSWELEKSDTELILASSLTNVAGPRIKMRPVEGLPLMHVEPPVFSGARMWAKRALDIGLSSCALVLLAPVFATIALTVRVDSKGPIVFRQRRVGKTGRDFVMFKFRTMSEDAEDRLEALQHENEGAGPLFKLKNDPRVTRVGRVLRKLSLDELPQIFNVLRGDMSLVGPRPPLRTEVECYENHTFRRLLIRPGLTGLWQVNGRSDLSWEDSVRLDLYYVENWSVVGDCIIMWHTLKAMIQPRGAY